jgi:hypothetical protein
MKGNWLLLSAALVTSSHVSAQQAPAEVSDAQVNAYRNGLDSGCRDAGHRTGDPKARVDSFCFCLLNILKSSLSYSEWQQAVFYSMKKQEREAMLVLDPHMAKAKACKAGS